MVVQQQAELSDRPGSEGADIVAMSGVSFRWPGSQNFSVAIDSFRLRTKSRTLVLGPSGSGKSTLLSLLCGIVTPDAGRIEILGTDITRISSGARDRFRAEHIGVLFQMFNLLPYGTVIDNIVLPLSFASARRQRARNQGGGDERRRAVQIIAALGLDETLASAPATGLSVGQQQRVAAARALIGSPEIIVADEPTSALDRGHQKRFLDHLFAQLDAEGTTLLMVSHDETMASRFDDVIELRDVVHTETNR